MYRFRRAMPTVAIALALSASAQAQPSYLTRGDAVERHRAALQARIQSLRAAIRDTLRLRAADLLPTLDPAPPPVRQGYRLLPRIVADAPQTAAEGPLLSVYSWPWTDTLIDRGLRQADSVSLVLRNAKQRADYQRLVTRFNALVAHRRLIDSHVEHNRQWQGAIATELPRYEAATTTIDGIMAGFLSPVTPAPAMPRVEIALDESARDTVTLRLVVITDIIDSAFLQAFQDVVESQWTAVVDAKVHRVALAIRRVAPATLYCRGATPDCGPAAGATIDMAGHLSHFPPGLAVLTTGASQPQVIGGRALVLGPRDIAPRTIAHEFGHLLGFDDAYLRGRRDLGGDGYAVVELVPDRRDVMASPGFGSVLPRHLAQLGANLRADRAMKGGLAAMYERQDAAAAVARFRETLALRPDHYGATFQLAKALDVTGDSTAAVVVWKRMLEMATASNDASTLRIVRSRLGLP